jgi:glycosyltransferase involved in cell wall biosynthesis
MKVLIVHPQMAFYGGAENVVVTLARELGALGVEAAVLTLSISEEVAKLCGGLKVIVPPVRFSSELRNPSLMGGIKRLMAETAMLRRMLREHAPGYDVVNVHNFPATWALAFSGCRNVVWMCNEPPDMWNKESPSVALRALRRIWYWVDRFIVRRSVDVVCVADEINAWRIKERYGCEVEIVPYGIEYDLFSSGVAERARKRYGMNGSFTVVQVGTVTPQKNQLASVRAVEDLKKRVPGARLILVGPGGTDYHRTVDEYIEKAGLRDCVSYIGHISKGEIADLYRASDVAIFPVKTQGGWLAPFEAICASRPVVVSDTMGAAAIIKREGFGVATQDYAGALYDIYTHPDEYLGMAETAKAWVGENLTWGNYARRKLEVFENLLAKGRENQ